MQELLPNDDGTGRTPAPLRRTLLLAAAGLGALGVASARATANGSISPSIGVDLPPATEEVSPFRVAIAPAAIADLRRRLAMTRWPDKETVTDGSQGVQLQRARILVDYWRDAYDMGRLERRLNAFPQFRTAIDGLGIHLLHVRSKHANALPIILTHGWPGSVVEFLDVIGPLTDPEAHGGRAEDAFHVVIPSLPGYGFSDKPRRTGWDVPRIATAWSTLMKRLGYGRWVAQGGDWGAHVTTWLGVQKAEGLAAIHLNLPTLSPPPLDGAPNAEEKAAIAELKTFFATMTGYGSIQETRPQTLGYGLVDSPVGQAMWIYEKFTDWSDSNRNPETEIARDAMLDDIMLYWITGTGASSARLYAEDAGEQTARQVVDIPVGVSIFPAEIYRPPRIWGERTYPKLFYWNRVAKGGHFAAFEQPALFTAELRACFARIRT
ncbi:epoxide hydrolase family protein [Sphingomonas sp. TREG-RG-20F-R18-01]|uniref:epoxide hydrolase family protein n=1 Tax=Sphingomonas sp. TREG-RG-20F-R18-01 TaxID=2914982 RepID=UPI001F57072E|nr:epoxide hydrolase family protein [Sphingomonas sp. TREG-RG-20F-R18-01]